MDHPAIDADNTAERYVTGRLSPEEEARFEEHYLDCPACQARVEAAERLQRGMKRLAEEAAIRAPGDAPAHRWSTPWRSLAAAALLAVALLPAWFEWRETRRLRSDLGATRETLVRTQAERGAAESRAAAAAESRDALTRQLSADRPSWANLPVVALTPVRGSAAGIGGPVRTLKLPPSPGWVALWVEPGDADFPAYRATLRTAQGAVVFAASRLALNDLGALLLTVHSTALSPGAYRLDVDGLPAAGAPVPVGRFSLRID